MNRKPKSSTAGTKARAWETRHDQDARGPLAENSSGLPDRSSRGPEGAPGETPSIHGTGYQQPAGAVHPNFPDQGNAALEPSPDDAEAIRRRAHELWEGEGRAEGHHERHWLQAEQELRSRKR